MKKIIIVGKAASGKDYLAKTFRRHGYTTNLSVTTRPMRVGEKHMVDYNYMSLFKFFLNRILFRFWEVKKFNGWYYGTLKKEWKNKDVFIFTPGGIETMPHKDYENSVIVFIDVLENVRRERLMERSDSDQVERRIKADEYDFSRYDKYRDKFTIYSTGHFDAKDAMIELLRYAGEDEQILKSLQ